MTLDTFADVGYNYLMNSATLSTVPANEGRWIIVGFQESYIVHPDGTTQASGCCERCGQGIRYVVTVQNTATKARLLVGQDCAVSLEGGPELAACRAARRAYHREQVRQEWEALGRAAAESKAARQAETARKNQIEFADLLVQCDEIMESRNVSDWERSFAEGISSDFMRGARNWPLSTETNSTTGFCEARAFESALSTARAPAPKCLTAAVGARVSSYATLVRRGSYESEFGVVHVGTFRADDGAILVWKTTAGIGLDIERRIAREGAEDFVTTEYRALKQGDRVYLTSTVKAHGDYRGVPQTTVTRAKIALEAPAPKAAKRVRKAA